ncbi:MAG TPA: type II toxin-antitoxin system RelE/ParE family toxin [Nonomuraea sp.]|nr:type II toxin-antitoxin system RelE/ParE family toxin [Nonomuraea sp.]
MTWADCSFQGRRTCLHYNVRVMNWGEVELEPEVDKWFDSLSQEDQETAVFYVDLLAWRGVLLDEPHTRQLRGKLRELRFHLSQEAVRITYWIASGRRIILLTVFRRQRMRETAEVERAVRAMNRCIAEAHTADEDE